MDLKMDFRWIISLLLMSFVAATFAQEKEGKTPIGETIYQEYRDNGIEKALEKYQEIKSNQADQYNLDEWQLNRIGYKIMLDDKDLDAAEKIFSFNMKEYPSAPNPQDSYADYLLEKGDTEEAKEYLENSIALAEKDKGDLEKLRIMRTSKAKLAKLENKHKQLDFLVGTWNVEYTSFENNPEGQHFQGENEILYDDELNTFTVYHKDDRGEKVAARVIVYDAVNDVYDVAYFRPGEPLGIRSATMKIVEQGPEKFEMIEEYTDIDGTEKKARHELIKTGENNMDWVIYEAAENGTDWKKVVALDMDRNE